MDQLSEPTKVLQDLYDTLLKCQYPGIEKVNVNSIKLILLNGSNRIDLLTWVLRKCPTFDCATLENLSNTALQDELLKCYSQLGICSDKTILLEDNQSKKQFMFIQFLTCFIKYTLNPHLTNGKLYNIKNDCSENIMDPLKEYIISDINIVPPTTHKEIYFSSIKDDKFQNNFMVPNISDPSDDIKVIPKIKINDIGKNGDEEDAVEKFIKAFDSVDSWSQSKRSTSLLLSNSNTINNDMIRIHSDFNAFYKTIQNRDEIMNMSTPKEMKRMETFDQLVENNVMSTSKLCTVYSNLKDCGSDKIVN